jgi:regulatory protein
MYGKKQSSRPRRGDEIKEPSRPAKQYVLWLLGRREWAAKELQQRLKFKGYKDASIEEAMQFLATHNLQSDAKYAASRVRIRSRSYGDRRLLQELNHKGVDVDTARDALTEAVSEQERAVQAAQRFAGLEPEVKLKAKAWRFLSARGFSSDAVKFALKQVAL